MLFIKITRTLVLQGSCFVLLWKPTQNKPNFKSYQGRQWVQHSLCIDVYGHLREKQRGNRFSNLSPPC